MSTTTAGALPKVRTIGFDAPFRWLSGALADFAKAPLPCLGYGVAVSLLCSWIALSLVQSNLAFWALTLSCGFVFVAPMLAMGLYEAGRRIEAGERPSIVDMMVVRAAVRQDVMYLGLALLLIYLLWGRIAQIVYGLSTYHFHTTVAAFVNFALNTDEGHGMLISGSIVGGIFAFFTFCLVAISTPMLLDQNTSVFGAVFTSLRAVSRNFAPMLLWAFIIAALIVASAATWFLALAVIFPWLGLASWRAYRDLTAA